MMFYPAEDEPMPDETQKHRSVQDGNLQYDDSEDTLKVFGSIYSVCTVRDTGHLDQIARGPIPLEFEYDGCEYKLTRRDAQTMTLKSDNRTLYVDRDMDRGISPADEFRVISEGKHFYQL